MAVTSGQLNAAKNYMRVDGNSEDPLITSLMGAAESYLADAGITRNDRNGAKYDLAMWSLTLHYYDHRDAVGTEAPLPTGLGPIIKQLQLSAVTAPTAAE